jgi:hypothetical protein
MFDTFLYAFLSIFIVTAIISLASLPGWLKIEEPYRKVLFRALLLEVVACVIGFVTTGIKAYYEGAKTILVSQSDLHGLLTKEPWSWHYANMNWRTVIFFPGSGEQLTFNATTFYRRKWDGGDVKIPIMKWRSIGPISISKEGRLEFDCIQTVLPDASSVYGNIAPELGDRKMKITLEPEITLRGLWATQNTNDNKPHYVGGIFLTKDNE